GQMPAPNNSCPCTASKPKVAGHSSGVLTMKVRVMKANAVVIKAIKQPQKRNMSADDLLFSLLIVCLVV
ncbi:MAG: hypothetical protein MKZ92_11500, partial [Pedosphaera sp.]|nr:hypothetical protein [Pedosphaera sp.]